MDQMDSTSLLIALLVPAALGLAAIAAVTTAVCLRLVPAAPSFGRLLLASLPAWIAARCRRDFCPTSRMPSVHHA